MKKQILLIISILICINLYSQQNTFNKLLYPYSGTTSINNIVKLDGFYYASIAHRDTPNTIQQMGILKISQDGNIIESNIFENKELFYSTSAGNAFTKTTDNHFLLCGAASSKEAGRRGFLAKINMDLDTLWIKYFTHPDTLIASQANPEDIDIGFTDILETPEGNYIMSAKYNRNCDNSTYNSLFMEVDTAGNLIWVNTMPLNIFTYCSIRDFEIDPVDSGFYFTCVRDKKIPRNTSLFKTNKYGDVLWYERVNTTSVYQAVPFETTVVDSITVLVGSGYSHNETDPYRSLVITSVNTSTRTINWERKYSFYNQMECYSLHQFMGIDVLKDNNILISTNALIDDTWGWGYRASLLKINQQGDSLWQRYYSYRDSDTAKTRVHVQLQDLVECDDGGLLFGGFYRYRDTTFAPTWLVKTDSMGLGVPAVYTIYVSAENILTIKQAPTLYPNPTTNNFNLQFSEVPNKAIELFIYNTAGQLVKKERLSAFQDVHQINIRELSTGTYFVRLLSSGETLYSNKFIKR